MYHVINRGNYRRDLFESANFRQNQNSNHGRSNWRGRCEKCVEHPLFGSRNA